MKTETQKTKSEVPGKKSNMTEEKKEVSEENINIPDIRIEMPENVRRIIHTLENSGYEAYAVGGCVRDSILGRKPADWDITTSARPEQVKALFPKTVDTGLQHGTVTVLLGGEGFEVTTYRIDGAYEDNRHPSVVSFTGNLREDLRRRDLTINAMAYNEREGLVDAFGGMRDLKERRIRCVGCAMERFQEDALRILRSVRFAAQLGFSIEPETAEAAADLRENLRFVSAERIRVELVKLLMSPHPELLRTAYSLGLTEIVLPEFDRMMETEQHNPHHCYTVGEHTLKALEYTPPEKCLRLAVLFHDVGKPGTKTTSEDGVDHFHGHAALSRELTGKILRRLKFDNETISRVTGLVLYHDCRPQADSRSVRRMVSRVGKELFPDLFDVMRADILAQSDFHRTEKLRNLDRLTELYEQILEQQQCLTIKDLAVTGRDLIGAGHKPGPELGAILQRMLEDVLEEPEHNCREYLMETYGTEPDYMI